MVGKAIVNVREFDEDSGYVRVSFDGFKPLIFITIIQFDNRDEIKEWSMITLQTTVSIVSRCHIL